MAQCLITLSYFFVDKIKINHYFDYMIDHHTKNKGDLGVLKVKVDLHQQGFILLNPETEHAPFDLVIYKEGTFKSVQVKYRSLNKRGAIEIAFRSCYCDSNGLVTKPVFKDYIDIYAVYCPDSDECYYFDPQLFGSSISIRVKASKNKQQNGINRAEDFRSVPGW